MSVVSKFFGKLASFDITGRTWTREVEHPYFQNLIYFGHKDPSRTYWEAEKTDPSSGEAVELTMKGDGELGPTPAEQAFCEKMLSDPDGLFSYCRAAFESKFQQWAGSPMPTNWREVFQLDGFSVPENGDESNEWEVCYFVLPAGHYFRAIFQGGKPFEVVVDG
jgi:hypothetical protein